jgi:hypothetical protein
MPRPTLSLAALAAVVLVAFAFWDGAFSKAPVAEEEPASDLEVTAAK